MHWENVIKRRDIGIVYVPSLPVLDGKPPSSMQEQITQHGQYNIKDGSIHGLGLPAPLETKIMTMFDKLGIGHPIQVRQIPATGSWEPNSNQIGGQFYIAIINRNGETQEVGVGLENGATFVDHSDWRKIEPRMNGMFRYKLGKDEIGLSAWFDE